MTIAMPLAGITVLDFGQVYNGPYCGFLLAQAGARVIKVESPRGEALRGGLDANANFPFAMLNGGKECITLNLKEEQGRELVKQLASHVDVVLENFSPGTMTGYGLGAEALCAINPMLIYASSTGFGDTGPYRDFTGMDISLQAMSGVMSVTGDDTDPPMKAGVAFCDFLAGAHLYSGIVTALYQRTQSGLGAVLDISMQDCVFPTLASQLGTYFKRGEQGPRTGNRHSGLALAPYNVYPTKDGFVALMCFRDGHWRRLCDVMGQGQLKEDERFGKASARAANMGEVDERVTQWTQNLNKAEVFAKAQAAGVICAPVQTLDDVVTDPHLHARGTLTNLAEDDLTQEGDTHAGSTLRFQTPLRFQNMTPPPAQQVQNLGASTDKVLADLLGLDAAALALLHERKAI